MLYKYYKIDGLEFTHLIAIVRCMLLGTPQSAIQKLMTTKFVYYNTRFNSYFLGRHLETCLIAEGSFSCHFLIAKTSFYCLVLIFQVELIEESRGVKWEVWI